MNRSKGSLIFTVLVLALALSSLASATTITNFTWSLSSSDPTQLGRLSRNAIPQDWTGGEPYPGVINPTTSYHYRTVTIPWYLFVYDSGDFAKYVQIEVDSTAATTFASAYLNSYDSTNLALNWLGDPGTSGDSFPNDTLFFQVLLGNPGDSLVIVMNESTINGGLNLPMTVNVEAFTDTMYTDPAGAPVPEPASMVLLGSGLVAPWLRKRFKK